MVEIDILARFVTAAILLWAVAAKAAARDPERLEAYGVPRALRSPGYLALALVEAAVAVALLAGFSFGPPAGIGLGVLFTLALTRARARGIRRLDCGCFGAKEHRVEVLILRALAFTAVAGLAAFPLEVSRPSKQALVVVALVVLAAAVIVLAALVLALYRQVGVLTLRVGPGVAFELAEEGPGLGEPAPELAGLAGSGPELAVFFSPGCRLCRQLAPGVRALGREGLAVHVVYESEQPETFERWAVPGTPFAAHIVNGTVVAKGTVNTLEQLEQLVSIGEERVERAAA